MVLYMSPAAFGTEPDLTKGLRPSTKSRLTDHIRRALPGRPSAKASLPKLEKALT